MNDICFELEKYFLGSIGSVREQVSCVELYVVERGVTL